MLLSDANGQKTKALEKFYAKKFYEGLAETEKFFAQAIKPIDRINAGLYSGTTHTITLLGELPVTGVQHTEGGNVLALDPAITSQSVTVVQYAYKITMTDKLMNLAELPLEDIFRSRLARHAAMTDDKVAFDSIFAVTNFVGWPTTGSEETSITFATNGTVTTPNTATSLTIAHVNRISAKMKSMRIPALPGGKYMCIGSPNSLAPLRAELKNVFQHTDSQVGKILSGYIGELYGVMFVEQTNISTKDVFFCGAEAGMKVIAQPEKIEFGTALDLNTKMEIGWKAIYAYSKIQNNRVFKFDGNPADVF